MDLGQAKKIFFITKKSENVTERTLETYGDVLKKFFDYLFERSILDVSIVDANHIRSFFVVLQERGLKGISQHRYFRTLRTFFLFLYQNDYINGNPMKNVKPPKVEKKPMRTFTGQEISKLMNAFDKTSFIGYRNYTMFCLLFSTGIRKGELTNLTIADVNVTNDVIRIDGKGRKTRVVVRKLFRKKVKVHVLNVGLLEDTAMGNFFLTTLLAVAELERNMIIERTQAGKEIARTKNGFKDGRPKKYTEFQLISALELLKNYSYTDVEKMTGISKSTLIRQKRNIKIGKLFID